MTLIILAAIGLIWTLWYIYRTVYAETIEDGIKRIETAELFLIHHKYDNPRMSQEEIDQWSIGRWD